MHESSSSLLLSSSSSLASASSLPPPSDFQRVFLLVGSRACPCPQPTREAHSAISIRRHISRHAASPIGATRVLYPHVIPDIPHPNQTTSKVHHRCHPAKTRETVRALGCTRGACSPLGGQHTHLLFWSGRRFGFLHDTTCNQPSASRPLLSPTPHNTQHAQRPSWLQLHHRILRDASPRHDPSAQCSARRHAAAVDRAPAARPVEGAGLRMRMAGPPLKLVSLSQLCFCPRIGSPPRPEGSHRCNRSIKLTSATFHSRPGSTLS